MFVSKRLKPKSYTYTHNGMTAASWNAYTMAAEGTYMHAHGKLPNRPTHDLVTPIHSRVYVTPAVRY